MIMSTSYGSSRRPNSFETRFTHRFLKSLFEIKTTSTTSSSALMSSSSTAATGGLIKMASYSSMARAVGSRRAWSRAFIFKIRCRIRHRAAGLVMRRRRKRTTCRIGHRVSKRTLLSSSRDDDHLHQVGKLRKVVPGGVKMDLCMLLEETAHYIQCLATQVKVMENMVNALSTT